MIPACTLSWPTRIAHWGALAKLRLRCKSSVPSRRVPVRRKQSGLRKYSRIRNRRDDRLRSAVLVALPNGLLYAPRRANPAAERKTGQILVSLSRPSLPCDRPVPGHNAGVRSEEPGQQPSQTQSGLSATDPDVRMPALAAHALGIPGAKSRRPARDKAKRLVTDSRPT